MRLPFTSTEVVVRTLESCAGSERTNTTLPRMKHFTIPSLTSLAYVDNTANTLGVSVGQASGLPISQAGGLRYEDHHRSNWPSGGSGTALSFSAASWNAVRLNAAPLRFLYSSRRFSQPRQPTK